MVNLTLKINGQFIGTFKYSYNDLLNSPASTDDIIELAFSRTAFVKGTQRYEWGIQLKERAQARPDDSFQLLIDEIREEAGRAPATSTSPLLVEENPLQLQKYYVLTAQGSTTLEDGTVVNKIRRVSILPLQDEQVRLLQSKGFDIELIGVWNSIEAFVNGFPDPIALQSDPQRIINGQPVTIFPDGRTSFLNEGGNVTPTFGIPQVCGITGCVQYTERTQIDDPEQNNPTDINGTEISIPIADNIINNLGRSPNDGTPSGQEQVAQSKNNDVILPLGILFILAGGF